jgi:histone H3/H4
MKQEEAKKIFKLWQEFAEINDKLGKVFRSVPVSFLPCPQENLEEALNIIAKNYYDIANHAAVNTIHEQMVSLARYKSDEDAFEDIVDDWIQKDPAEVKIQLENLKIAKENWLEFNKKNNIL